MFYVPLKRLTVIIFFLYFKHTCNIFIVLLCMFVNICIYVLEGHMVD